MSTALTAPDPIAAGGPGVGAGSGGGPDPRSVRDALLWCGRSLCPGGPFHAGDLAIRVRFGPGVEVVVRPTPAAAGLRPPAGLNPVPVAAAVIPPAAVARHLLSDAERTIVVTLADLGPCPAAEVQEEVAKQRVVRGRFYALWSELQVRRLVEETADGSFAVAAPWVTEVARAGRA